MDILEKQIEYLNGTMKDTASEANSFLLKYHFGGLIAVLALLNIDLVLVNPASFSTVLDYALLSVAILFVVLLSYKYFRFVLNHYCRFSESHRKLKYKYELTLHLLLCQGDNRDYQFYLEQSVSGEPESEVDEIDEPDTENYEFNYFAKYLLNHHRIKFRKLKEKDDSYLWIAMLIIALTLSIRTIFIVIGS